MKEFKTLQDFNSSVLNKSEKQILNKEQLNFFLGKTPATHIYTRPGKGGGTWKFVTGTYVKQRVELNTLDGIGILMIAFDVNMAAKQAIVHGKLTCRANGATVIKQQFGRADIKLRKADGAPLDLGNDLKAASTDALKKCASELGIASDVYGESEFKSITVTDENESSEKLLKELSQLLILKKAYLSESDLKRIEEIIIEEEVNSYQKAIETLKTF
jgi:hypothetical protein